jgi:Xaa-Pro dipeptidase
MSDKKLLDLIPQGAECVFPQDEFDARVAALRVSMAAKDIELLLVSGPENIFYLSGQQTPGYYMFQCLAIPIDGPPFLIIRGLEALNARLKSRIEDITGYSDDADPAKAVAEALLAHGWQGRRVAIDMNGWFLTVSLYNRLVAAFGPLLDGSFLVEPLRRVKSPREIAALERAAVANDAGMEAGLLRVRAGATDNTVAAAIMAACVEAGSEYVGMEPFVTGGSRAGVPHSTWHRQRFQPGEVVILETSACYFRYHASLYRTVAIGQVPQLSIDMYAACQEALQTGIDRMRPGVTCAEVHNAIQAVIDRHGYTEGYRKRSGYSVGISFAPDWGEGNIMSLYRGFDIPLQPGMSFHVPITLRDYNKFTVAVSETVIVTEGAARTLGTISRDLVRV